MINRISDKIKKLRKEKGYTQAQLANVSSVSIAFIKKVETRQYNNPSVLTLDKIATALEVDIKELF
ncbi:MAG: helix-turn-helix transcriptional regulator [Bacteroidetes bacterium]|nr:helix-turn-helix transcriptional regulator [Bacteroidota bacterium]